MSGVEAFAVLGVISSIITIVDEIKKLYDAASNADGLPEAFREVAGRLPIVRNILDLAKQYIDKGEVDEVSCKAMKHVIEACEKKAEKLNELFRKAIPSDKASRTSRYALAARAVVKENLVEELMKGMLEDLQLLTSNHGMKSVTDTQLEQVAKAIADMSAILHSSAPIVQGSEEDQVLMTLFLTDPMVDREKLVETKGTRVDGTCEWIKSNDLYDSWLRSSSQLLWLSGGPAKGKTMISIFLAEELERTAKLSQNVLFLQYFCDNKDEKRNKAVAIMRGLIFQLLQAQPNLFHYILPSFKIQKESLFIESSFETLWRIFDTMIRDPSLGDIYCIIDGLDECDEALSVVILKKFKTFFSMNSTESWGCHFKLMIVSRDLPDFIPDLLSSFPRIRLDDADSATNNDIHQFIDFKVNELSALKQYPQSLRVHVKNVFESRAQGTFLWVGIVANELRKYKATEVEKALELFPSGLEDLYARMLLQIDVNRRDSAAKILRWVVMACRPLTLSELSDAIEICHESSTIFSRVEIMKDQVSYCGYFLTIKEDEVGLIHQSAKEYLLRTTPDANPDLEFFRVKENMANLEIARKCLGYLQDGALANGPVDLRTNISHSQAFPLLLYAVRYWPWHARSLARSDDIFDLTLPFYSRNSPVRNAWWETFCWFTGVPYFKDISSTALLHIASVLGLVSLVENLIFKQNRWINWLKLPIYVNKRDDMKSTPLHYAARTGEEAVVRLLLEKGANIESRDNENSTPLHAAAFRGHEVVIRLLLEKGANIEARDEYKDTPLHAAIEKEHESVIKLLLEKDANIEARNEYKDTPLHVAIQNGHESVIKLLLEKGANVETRNEYKNTPLHVAIEKEHESVIKLLLEQDANIEARNEYKDTPLHVAILNGHESVIKLLLEKKANIEARDGYKNTPLHAAIELKHESVIKLLLEKGANIEARNEYKDTPLHVTIENGHESVIKLLLEKNANIEAQGWINYTSLHYAASKGHESVIKLLFEKGANIEARNENKDTPLHVAIENEHESVIKLLLEKGANIEAQGWINYTPLHCAVSKGHETVIRLLLEKGANIEATNKYEETALIIAAQRGQEIVMRLLLEKGANIEATDKNDHTALWWAIKKNHKTLKSLLREKGAT